jgi:4-aminobutyrate aminotransferase-like enzyme
LDRRRNVRIPGPRSAALAQRLRAYESRNVTFLAEDFTVFWESAKDATVVDVDGNHYIDCTAAFGVANAGHCNPRVAAAVADQAARLVHGMGDVHPTEIRLRLLERLAGILPTQLDKYFLASTGSEAIEAALKTAMLYTGKARFAAYHGGYHGLSFGALAVSGIERFRVPFAGALAAQPLLIEYPREARDNAQGAASRAAQALSERDDLAALVIEPIQGRAGAVVPPSHYLRELRALCDRRGIVMIVDEIFTGFGRTGTWFAIEHDAVVPDILCIGKAMGSGLPISAAIGRSAIMEAWPLSTGEALHTSTYLGNPIACAAALATIDEIEERGLLARSRRLGEYLGERLGGMRSLESVVDVRGRGLLRGVALRDPKIAAAAVKRSLHAGAIFLQSGIHGDVVSISPPLVIGEEQLALAIDILQSSIEESQRGTL